MSLLSVVGKIFEKLVHKKFDDYFKKFVLFSDFQYDFRSSHSTVDLLILVSDQSTRDFNWSSATQG